MCRKYCAYFAIIFSRSLFGFGWSQTIFYTIYIQRCFGFLLFFFISYPKTHFYSFHEPITIIIVMMMVSDVSAKIRCARNIPLGGGLCSRCTRRALLCLLVYGTVEGRWQRLDEVQKCISYWFIVCNKRNESLIEMWFRYETRVIVGWVL